MGTVQQWTRHTHRTQTQIQPRPFLTFYDKSVPVSAKYFAYECCRSRSPLFCLLSASVTNGTLLIVARLLAKAVDHRRHPSRKCFEYSRDATVKSSMWISVTAHCPAYPRICGVTLEAWKSCCLMPITSETCPRYGALHLCAIQLACPTWKSLNSVCNLCFYSRTSSDWPSCGSSVSVTMKSSGCLRTFRISRTLLSSMCQETVRLQINCARS